MLVTKRKDGYYKEEDNILEIDKRLHTYEYEFKLNKISYYIFDKELNCIYISDFDLKKKKPLKDIFPTDLINFFQSMLTNTLIRNQILHVNLNNNHILFTTNNFMDHLDKIIGVMLYEIPFSQVQLLPLLHTIDYFHIPINCIVDITGNIVAMEQTNWERFLDEYINIANLPNDYMNSWRSDKIIHSNIFSSFTDKETRIIYYRIFKYLINTESPPFRFCVNYICESIERKLLISLSRSKKPKS